jgi:hypothetical protein
MIQNNHKPAQSWSPTDRRLWLAKHGAPDNFVLLTALEVAAIEIGIHAERRARLALQAECEALQADLNWLEQHPLKANVLGGSDDGGTATFWGIGAATGTLREAIAIARAAQPKSTDKRP